VVFLSFITFHLSQEILSYYFTDVKSMAGSSLHLKHFNVFFTNVKKNTFCWITTSEMVVAFEIHIETTFHLFQNKTVKL
jgi:hypothetical protein